MYEGNNIHDEKSFERGLEFQDFIITLLLKEHGIVIQPYSSKKYQFEIGESLQGYEIKYDARSTGDCTYYNCNATNNVAIEVEEKTNVNNKNWIKSGIFREDNTTHYLIGNYHGCWIIEKRILRKLYHLKLYPIVETLSTIKSMLIPIDKMDSHSIHVFVFNNNFGKQAKLEL